ncbi:DNA mismatch repair protein, C-terminal domain protein [Bacteriovorax sp. BSW11_IV]|uniref:DNA mismatch repair endonuclease MutL n=1 Tax=Bacteriovorax sp. BSW11_IV TaxID=1353529 RepID=UPI000389E9B8|nr:DNA mismatch repair endonuclease MutL [Bacteriovorax sp. BSW11_IV]EQC48201.1 DNA mismatch repair protein, C-terminal domain protein [Bacteriovorax sp. BSW11_IV]
MISKKIHLLPEHLIDQIKAGEVIERPASIIKEVIENSLDAGATKIDIQIRDNGLELISIEDNGEGMSFEDLPYAFCRHATSKIERFEDIYSLFSFGFRGEALASMSSIARITCTSIPKGNPENGGKIVIHAGETVAHTPYQSSKHGTSLYIKDLFYNTPARLKFIKSKTSEKGSLKRILYAFILSNPEVTFSIKWDDKEKEIYKGQIDNEQKRVKDILFKKGTPESETSLLSISGEYEDYSIHGYTSVSSSRGNAGKSHYLFINGRLFTDRQIHQTMIRNMEKFWAAGETGHYFVMIKVPPSAVDVNVHPNKTQVKFFKPSVVFSLVSAATKKGIEDFKKQYQGSTNSLLSSLQSEQRNLFSDSEQREQSLRDFYQTPFKMALDLQNSDGADLYNHQSPFTVKTSASSSFIRLSSNFALIPKSETNQFFLVNIGKLIGSFIAYNLLNRPVTQESDTTPLLISEPYQVEKGTHEEKIHDLIQFGLEIDRLDDEVIALRTIPSYLNDLPIRETLSPLFDNLDLIKKAELDDLITFFKEKYSFSSNYDIENEINLILKKLPISYFLENKAMIHITNNLLERFFI